MTDAAKTVRIGSQKIPTHHLPKDRTPARLGQIAANPESGQLIMAFLLHLWRGIASQDINQMSRPEPFPCAQHRRERLAHGVGGIEKLRGPVAQIAVPARFGGLAKVAKQNLPPTARRLGQPQKGIEPGMVGLLALWRGDPLIDLRPAQADIVGTIERQRLGRSPVAARAADLLIIGLDAFREIRMGNPADVRFVDAHTKGDGCTDDQPVLLLEPHLDAAALIGLHPAVIVAGRMTGLTQGLRQNFGP